MWPGGSNSGGTRGSTSTATVSSTVSSSNSINSTTGTASASAGAAAPQPSFSGIRVNDQRGSAVNHQRWLDHQQAQQWNNAQSAQWGPHTGSGGGGGSGTPQTWAITAVAQPWPGGPSSNTGTSTSTYAEHAKKNMVGRGTGGQVQVQGRYDQQQQQQQWGQMKVDQHTSWDTGNLTCFGIQGVNDAKCSVTEWGSVSAPSTRWGPPVTQWPLHPAAVSSTAAPDWAAAAAVVAAAAAAHHRHDPSVAPWTGNPGAPHPATAALLPQPGAAWGHTPAAAQQASATALSNTNEQYDPNPQTPGPWVAPQPQEMNNDMMWHDPNPKQKKVQRDTGTAIWGDPSQQPVEIKRWKDAEMEDYSHVQSAIASGGDWNAIPISSNGNTVCTVINGTSGCSIGAGYGTNSCCSATGTNISTPTTTGNGPWPDGAHPESSSSGHPERWQQHGTWSEKMDSAGDNHHPPDLLSGLPPMNAIGIHGLMDSSVIRPDIGGSGNAGSAAYTSLTQQIADRIRIAVNKGLIDVSMLSRPLPQNALVVLNALLQKFPKLEQAQQEYQQVMRALSSQAQKVESERLVVEINGLQHEIIQLRNTLSDLLKDQRFRPNSLLNGTLVTLQQQQDGQSRLQQWKQANATSSQDCNTDKLCGSSDPSVSGLVAGTQGMSLDERADWKTGSLDWSPPLSRTGEKSTDVTDKDDLIVSSGENKHHQGAPSSTNQSGTGTPTPQQSQTQVQTAPVDDGPQEFVPGKKWEWRDPNKVAEDPNATPGTCKPNPLLTTSSTAQSFHLYGNNANNCSLPQGNIVTNLSNPVTTTANYLSDLQSIHRTPSAGFLGWNSGISTMGSATPIFAANDMWPAATAGGAVGRQSRITSGPSAIGPFAHAGVRAGPGAAGGPAIGPFQRSVSNPFGVQQPQQQQWIFVQLHGVNEKQVQMLCQKVGQIMQAICPHGAPFVCLKFFEPAEEVIRRLKAEAPFLPVKSLPESEVDRLLKLRATLPYGGAMGPVTTTAEPWMFGAGGIGGGVLPGNTNAADLLTQQPHFHAGDAASDLTRPF